VLRYTDGRKVVDDENGEVTSQPSLLACQQEIPLCGRSCKYFFLHGHYKGNPNLSL